MGGHPKTQAYSQNTIRSSLDGPKRGRDYIFSRFAVAQQRIRDGQNPKPESKILKVFDSVIKI